MMFQVSLQQTQKRRAVTRRWLMAWGLLALWVYMSAPAWAADAGWPRHIQTARGIVSIPKMPTRIVSTSVTLTGSLLAIGAPVVASGATAPNNRVADEQGFFRQWGTIARQRGVQQLYIGEANAESVAAQMPDLIVVSATGGDSAVKLAVQFSTIAPTIVINYADKSWQQLVAVLGNATGRDAQAAQLVADFNRKAAQVRQQLQLPPQPVSALVYDAGSRQANLWTAASAQGQLLQQLGFQLAPLPESLDSAQKGNRKDIVLVGGENLPNALNGQSLLLFAATEKDGTMLAGNPFLKQLPPVKDGQIYALGPDTFRLDYYSASLVLDRLATLFGQKTPAVPHA